MITIDSDIREMFAPSIAKMARAAKRDRKINHKRAARMARMARGQA